MPENPKPTATLDPEQQAALRAFIAERVTAGEKRPATAAKRAAEVLGRPLAGDEPDWFRQHWTAATQAVAARKKRKLGSILLLLGLVAAVPSTLLTIQEVGKGLTVGPGQLLAVCWAATAVLIGLGFILRASK